MLGATDRWQKVRMSLWTEQHGGHLVLDSGTFHEVVGEESLIRVQGKLRTENNDYVEFC